MIVVSTSRAPIGRLEGVLVDPRRLAVEFLVVAARNWFVHRHYLLPFRAARLDSGAHEVEVDIEPRQVDELEQVDVRRCPSLSASDLDDTSRSHVHAA